MGLTIALFVAFLATALSLGGALAHLYALPTKLHMTLTDYFVAQGIYRGWAYLGVILVVQLFSLIGVVLQSGQQPGVRRPALLGIVALVSAQAIFWIWTQPANKATNNWTMQPANAAALRVQWEWSHAAGAVLQLAVICLVFVAALRRAP